MTRDVWKSYEDNLLTHSAAHYLMTIHELLAEQGYARVTDIAKRLNITRGSCSISLKPLKKRGLVVEDANRFLSLSDEGRRMAEIVEKNDELLESFFRDVLGVYADQAEVDACKIEHLLSIESSVKLCTFVELMKSDHKAVKEFLKLLRRTGIRCTHDVSRCHVCQTICFYDARQKKSETRTA
jgi:DtxR family Mn-dependent transcriptional regulator